MRVPPNVQVIGAPQVRGVADTGGKPCDRCKCPDRFDIEFKCRVQHQGSTYFGVGHFVGCAACGNASDVIIMALHIAPRS